MTIDELIDELHRVKCKIGGKSLVKIPVTISWEDCGHCEQDTNYEDIEDVSHNSIYAIIAPE